MSLEIKRDTNEEYHSKKEYISSSGLKKIYTSSVFHFLNDNFTGNKSTDLGTAIHAKILEPENFNNEVHLMGQADGRTKAGKAKIKEAEELHKGKVLLNLAQENALNNMLANYHSNELAMELIDGSECEVSHYCDEFTFGSKVRVRVDSKKSNHHGLRVISDVKSCKSASPDEFKRQIRYMGWDLQAAFYLDVLGYDEFYFIAIENNAPYHCEVYVVSQENIDNGRRKYEQALQDYMFWKETGIVTGYRGEKNEQGAIII